MNTVFINKVAPPQSGMRYDLAEFVTPDVLAQLGAVDSRADSAGTAFTLRALTEIMSRTFDVKYPDLKARAIFPIDTSVDPGAEGFVWQQFDRVNKAALIVDYAADLPASEVVVKEGMGRCFSLGTSYNYSMQDLRKARMAGAPLETRKALAARRAMEEAFDQIAWFGVQTIPGGIRSPIINTPASVNTLDPLAAYGFTNFPNLTREVAGIITTGSNPGGTAAAWNTGIVGTSDTTAQTSVRAILADLNNLALRVVQGSNGVHQPDTLIFPLSSWSSLATIARSVTFTDDTLLQYIQKSSPFIKNIFWSPMLETAGFKIDGLTPGPRIMICERNPENFQLVVPMEFEQLPPQIVNFMYKVPCHQRVGGIRVSYPKAIAALDGTAG